MLSTSFADLGVCKEICDVISELGWKTPTEIQLKAIPLALAGKDIIGLAETGSGKTGAFAIPILQNLLLKPRYYYALILTPTRELALQIKKHFLDIGSSFGLKVLCLVGGQHIEDQFRSLRTSKYHILVATLGRIIYHLENSKECRLHRVRYFVIDEADQIISGNFDSQIQTIISKLPEKRITYMYSATMTNNLDKIQSVCLRKPIRLETSKKYATVDKLEHAFIFLPDQKRNIYVAKLLAELEGNAVSDSRAIIFTKTARESIRLGEMLKFITSPSRVAILNGLMRQDKRGHALQCFRSGEASILVATDLASRGLDIPEVDLVINYDVPVSTSCGESAKAYVHRVGRTARAGRLGRAITLVTPYSATHLKVIESLLGSRIAQIAWRDPTPNDDRLSGLVNAAFTHAQSVLREKDKRKRCSDKQTARKRRKVNAGEHDDVFGGSDSNNEGLDG